MSDATNLKLEVQDATDVVPMAEVLEAAHSLGVQHLPDVERLVTGRVWPAGDRWVGEIGEGQSIRALDEVYESMVDAIKAVEATIRQLRDATVDALTDAGTQAGRLAASCEQWQPPILKVFADTTQRQAWLLQLPG